MSEAPKLEWVTTAHTYEARIGGHRAGYNECDRRDTRAKSEVIEEDWTWSDAKKSVQAEEQ